MAKKTWSRSSYGKTALSAKFSASGLDNFLAKIEAAGKNIDVACKKAVNETLPIIKKAMIEGAERHRDTGKVVDHIEIVDARQQGNLIHAQVGINLDKHPEAFEAVFQEYGDGHSPGFPDPFIRPAVDDNQKQINNKIKKVLRKEGMPVE